MGGGGGSRQENSINFMANIAKALNQGGGAANTTASLPSNPGTPTLVDTGATPASGTRPIGPVQFYQPVYHPTYENYRLSSTPDVSAYGVNMQNPFAYQPHNFQPTMPTAQQAMGDLPQGIASLPTNTADTK